MNKLQIDYMHEKALLVQGGDFFCDLYLIAEPDHRRGAYNAPDDDIASRIQSPQYISVGIQPLQQKNSSVNALAIW